MQSKRGKNNITANKCRFPASLCVIQKRIKSIANVYFELLCSVYILCVSYVTHFGLRMCPLWRSDSFSVTSRALVFLAFCFLGHYSTLYWCLKEKHFTLAFFTLSIFFFFSFYARVKPKTFMQISKWSGMLRENNRK